MSNPLFDKEFLKELDKYPHHETHVRITSLDYDDKPVEQIEGICTGGSINVDGASALRRTCSLTLLAKPDTEIADYHWAFNHKFKIEIGLTNHINSDYDDIIWFPQGIYVVNNFSKSESPTGLNISLSGQDKMCRLNGTMSGLITVDTDFGEYDEVQANGHLVKKKLLIYDAIEMAVHEYGQERKSNILINDLDVQGMDLWKYRGDIPLYMFYALADNSNTNTYGTVMGVQFGTNNATVPVKEWTGTEWEGTYTQKSLSNLHQYYRLHTLDASINTYASKVNFKKSGYPDKVTRIIKIGYGDLAGYHQIPLTYPSSLMVKAGTAVTTGVLDKMKNVLGEYEYFYDLDGRFVFQKKKTYLNELFSPINGDIVEPMMTHSPYSYEFDDFNMFTNISYSPQIANVKNDFVIWGTKDSGTAIHARYAIQKKPTYYKTCGSYDKSTGRWSGGTVYRTSPRSATDDGGKVVDWRELIYQMAQDYNKYNQYPGFYTRVDEQNTTLAGKHFYPDGKTNCEQYYTDISSFWRYLYDLSPETNSNRYYPYQDYYEASSPIKPGWNKLIHTNPSGLVFWFDFLDVGDAPLSEFSVDAIGTRSKIENVSGNSVICAPSAPEVLFTVGEDTLIEDKNTTAYTVSNISADKETLFTRASSCTSLVSKANELIYQYACCSEGVNLTCIPIYYLEPNTRIKVDGIGDLIVSKISYNLAHGGTMSLTCTKIIPSIY